MKVEARYRFWYSKDPPLVSHPRCLYATLHKRARAGCEMWIGGDHRAKTGLYMSRCPFPVLLCIWGQITLCSTYILVWKRTQPTSCILVAKVRTEGVLNTRPFLLPFAKLPLRGFPIWLTLCFLRSRITIHVGSFLFLVGGHRAPLGPATPAFPILTN